MAGQVLANPDPCIFNQLFCELRVQFGLFCIEQAIEVVWRLGEQCRRTALREEYKKFIDAQAAVMLARVSAIGGFLEQLYQSHNLVVRTLLNLLQLYQGLPTIEAGSVAAKANNKQCAQPSAGDSNKYPPARGQWPG